PAEDPEVPRPCDEAVAADPEWARAFEARAQVLNAIAEGVRRRGGDFEPWARRTIEDARRALELDRDLLGAPLALAGAHRSRAVALETSDRDASEPVLAAIRVLERLVERHPLFVPARVDLGSTWARRAYNLEDLGEDPTEAYREAFTHYREAIDLAPSIPRLHARLGLVSTAYGERLHRRGEDPGRVFAAADEALERAAELQPDEGLTFSVLGYAAWARARWEWTAGGDAGHHFTRAADWMKRALELDPDHMITHSNLAQMQGIHSWYLMEEGRIEEAGQVLESAREALEDLKELAPEQTPCLEAGIEYEAGFLDLIREPEVAAEHFRRAMTLSAEGRKTFPRSCALNAGWAHLGLARWRREEGLPPANHVQQGLEASEEILSANPESSTARELRANLFLERARSTRDPELRRERSRRALEAFEEWFQYSPTWESVHQDLVEEARRLADEEGVQE
ncbi:MAG: hypothetical protein R3234_09925, partial [Thermoanaerobaculia bacterium]|nr:hypothetical protein [Thermoanaerobaculia bacterium]